MSVEDPLSLQNVLSDTIQLYCHEIVLNNHNRLERYKSMRQLLDSFKVDDSSNSNLSLNILFAETIIFLLNHPSYSDKIESKALLSKTNLSKENPEDSENITESRIKELLISILSSEKWNDSVNTMKLSKLDVEKYFHCKENEDMVSLEEFRRISEKCVRNEYCKMMVETPKLVSLGYCCSETPDSLQLLDKQTNPHQLDIKEHENLEEENDKRKTNDMNPSQASTCLLDTQNFTEYMANLKSDVCSPNIGNNVDGQESGEEDKSNNAVERETNDRTCTQSTALELRTSDEERTRIDSFPVDNEENQAPEQSSSTTDKLKIADTEDNKGKSTNKNNKSEVSLERKRVRNPPRRFIDKFDGTPMCDKERTSKSLYLEDYSENDEEILFASIIPTSKKKRRARSQYTPEETDAIMKGIKVFGWGSWATIKNSYSVLSNRTNIDIKDKARNLKLKREIED